MAITDRVLPFRVFYVDTFEDQSGPGSDGWCLVAAFEAEADALEYARAQASCPQPGAGDLADRVVVLCDRQGQVFSQKRPG